MSLTKSEPQMLAQTLNGGLIPMHSFLKFPEFKIIFFGIILSLKIF